MKNKNLISRRSTLKSLAALTAAATLGSTDSVNAKPVNIPDEDLFSTDIRAQIYQKVQQTPFIDTHEHLPDEHDRLKGSVKCDDWTALLCHYLDSDILSAGMPKQDYDKFFSPKIDPLKKWPLLEPYWPAIKNTGYAQAVRITIKKLYGVD